MQYIHDHVSSFAQKYFKIYPHFLYMVRVYSFSVRYKIPWYEYNSVSVLLLLGIWMVSSLGLLYIVHYLIHYINVF